MKQLTQAQLFNRIQALCKGQNDMVVVKATLATVGITLRDIKDPNFQFMAINAVREMTNSIVNSTPVPAGIVVRPMPVPAVGAAPFVSHGLDVAGPEQDMISVDALDLQTLNLEYPLNTQTDVVIQPDRK